MEAVSLFAGQPAVDLQYLKTLRHNRGIHECDRPRNSRHEFSCHIAGVDDLRPNAGFQTEYFGDPVLPELRLRHAVDSLQNHVALARGWRADQ